MSFTESQAEPDSFGAQQRVSDAKSGSSVYALFGKRAFDIVVSVSLIVALAPVMLSITLILMIMEGTPFFTHERIGRGRRSFKCLKFRTMGNNSARDLRFTLRTDVYAAQEWRDAQKLTVDPRITWIGRFLRSTSLDELPQLINVLRGQMSMVGPRPVTESELKFYGADLALYLSVRPGLTGHWQVHGRGTTIFEERVAMDRSYVRSINFLTDIKLMIQTAGVVLKRTGS
jgi:lipopolysaccharide/colanic/teichoic acid biosynthesis glycosyltransferase